MLVAGADLRLSSRDGHSASLPEAQPPTRHLAPSHVAHQPAHSPTRKANLPSPRFPDSSPSLLLVLQASRHAALISLPCWPWPLSSPGRTTQLSRQEAMPCCFYQPTWKATPHRIALHVGGAGWDRTNSELADLGVTARYPTFKASAPLFSGRGGIEPPTT